MDVSVYTSVVIKFSADLDPDTVTSDTVFLTDSSNNKVAFGDLYTQFTSVYINLSNSVLLDPGVTYTVNVTTGVTDVGGHALASDYASSFTTASP